MCFHPHPLLSQLNLWQNDYWQNNFKAINDFDSNHFVVLKMVFKKLSFWKPALPQARESFFAQEPDLILKKIPTE